MDSLIEKRIQEREEQLLDNLLTLQDIQLEDTLPQEEATVESWTTSSMTTSFFKNLLGLFLLYMQNVNQKHKSL